MDGVFSTHESVCAIRTFLQKTPPNQYQSKKILPLQWKNYMGLLLFEKQCLFKTKQTKIQLMKTIFSTLFCTLGFFSLAQVTTVMEASDKAQKLIVTEIQDTFECDAFFPPIDDTIWQESQRQHGTPPI